MWAPIAISLRAKQELRGLSEPAVTTLREALTGKDVPIGVRVKVALSVLQGTGTLEPEPLGKTDPRKIEFDQLLQMMH